MFWRSVKNIVLKCSFIFFNLHLLQNLSKKLRGHFIKLKPLSKYHMTLSLCGAANHKKVGLKVERGTSVISDGVHKELRLLQC